MKPEQPENCRQIEDMLVEYADGQLAQDRTDAVAEHLDNCPDCRQKVDALKKSLTLTRVIWQNNLQPKPAKKPLLLRWAISGSVAAAVLLLAGLFLLFGTDTQQPQPIPTLAQIEREINHAAIAAKLLAVAEIISKNPDSEQIVQKEYRYIVKAYPNTAAAKKVKTLIK